MEGRKKNEIYKGKRFSYEDGNQFSSKLHLLIGEVICTDLTIGGGFAEPPPASFYCFAGYQIYITENLLETRHVIIQKTVSHNEKRLRIELRPK
jgi:hypothetical protein